MLRNQHCLKWSVFKHKHAANSETEGSQEPNFPLPARSGHVKEHGCCKQGEPVLVDERYIVEGIGAHRGGYTDPPHPEPARDNALSSWQLLCCLPSVEVSLIPLAPPRSPAAWCPTIYKVPWGGDVFGKGIKSQHPSMPACVRRLQRRRMTRENEKEMGWQPAEWFFNFNTKHSVVIIE